MDKTGHILIILDYIQLKNAIRIQVFFNGTYNIVCNSNMDTYGSLYNDNFYRTSSTSTNLIMSNDDGNGNREKYILVVTTFSVNVTGAFTVYTIGGLSFSKINEWDEY